MKKTLLLVIMLGAVFLPLEVWAQAPKSDLSFSINFTGKPNEADVEAATWLVVKRNAEIVSQNAQIEAQNAERAAADPPEDPLPLIPILATGTPAELKASYLQVLGDLMIAAHKSYIVQAAKAAGSRNAAKLWENATSAARQAALDALQAGQKPTE